MKKTSKIMYIIAIVFNCISFFVFAGMFVGAYVMKRYPNAVAKLAVEYGINELNTVAKVLNMVTPVIIAGVIGLILAILEIIFGTRALKALQNNEENSTPHIIMIILGAMGEIFYLLAGIFGVVNASQVKKQTPVVENSSEGQNKTE